MYYCSVVSAQDLQGNNEAYAELIVLGESGPRGTGLGMGLSCYAVCPPSALLLSLSALSPPLLSPHSTTSHLGLSVPCTPDRDPLPHPTTFQISQSQTRSGKEWGLYPFLASVFKSTEMVRVDGH